MAITTDLGQLQVLQHAVTVASFSLVVAFLVNLYKARLRFIELKKQGLRMPPHHPLFGHLLLAIDILSKLPPDAHPSYLPSLIRRAVPDVGPVFYLDMWPFAKPILIVASPTAAYQFTQERSLPKSSELRAFLKPLAENKDLVSLEGQSWKLWRSVYNPGFSATHLIHLVPQIMKEVFTFREILRERSQARDVFLMEEVTVNLTMDTIGRVIMDTHFDAQRSRNQFVSALRAQISWFLYGTEINPFVRWNPLRPIFQWYYRRQMDHVIGGELERRFAVHQDVGNTAGAKYGKSRTVMDLALDKYLEEQHGSLTTYGMDKNFKIYAICQMKVFILAGHDTTSSTLCYIFYLLASNPQSLQRVRAEHDSVFGADLTQTSAKITEDPYTLNKLPFTIAVIKEALRLFPAASTTREGEPGFSVTEDGCQYPTNGFVIWSQHRAIHREPLYWPQPDDFVPERWLVSQDDPLYPIKGAWRPFEFGPRNCIGQELAMLEIKIVMVMTVREFDITACYEEWDHRKGRTGPKTVNGERAYQVLKGTTRPADGMPCRVSVASR